MATFKAIDQAATTSDYPYHTALAQGIRTNVIATRENRLRSLVKSYDLRDLPRMYGTLGWSEPNRLVYTMIPFVLYRSHRQVTQIDVEIVGVIDDAATTITTSKCAAVVVTLHDATSGSFPDLSDIANMDNAVESGNLTSSANDQHVSLTGLELPASDEDAFMVFVCFKSALSGSADLIDDNATSGQAHDHYGGVLVQYNNSTPHTETTGRPDFVVGFDNGSGKVGPPNLESGKARHAIHIDDAHAFETGYGGGIYVYPPYDNNFTYGAGAGALGTPRAADRLVKSDMSYMDLKSVQIVESAETAFVMDSALNAAKPASVEAHNRIIVEAEKVALRYTNVFHCGGNIRPTVTDLYLTSGGSISKLHNFVEYDDSGTWTTLGWTTVRKGDLESVNGSTGINRVMYKVGAILALSGSAESDEGTRANAFARSWTHNTLALGLECRLILDDRNEGGTAVTGTTRVYPSEVANTFPVGEPTSLARPHHTPVGYLLRLHHISQRNAMTVNDIVSHTLMGTYPSDVWSTGRFIPFESDILDTESGAYRYLKLQVRGTDEPPAGFTGTGTDAAAAFIHLVTWTVLAYPAESPMVVEAMSI
jgi:hypothetical protein